jgi:hypothetical protein
MHVGSGKKADMPSFFNEAQLRLPMFFFLYDFLTWVLWSFSWPFYFQFYPLKLVNF